MPPGVFTNRTRVICAFPLHATRGRPQRCDAISFNLNVISVFTQSDQTPTLNFPIPVVTNFKYLGVSIFPSLDLITINNYTKALKDVEEDLMKWGKLPTSFHSRLSVIKMNVLPRLNFISSMIPLAPPNNYWKKLHSIINQFLWNNKKPRIKTSTLQRHKSAGGVNLLLGKMWSG